MYRTFLTVLALLGAVTCHYYPAAWNPAPVRPAPRCVLGDQLRYLPMYVVPEREIKVLQDYRTQYYTPSPAVVTFIGQVRITFIKTRQILIFFVEAIITGRSSSP